MKNKFLQYLFLSCSLMVLFSACRKDPHFNGKETFQSGKTFVWITEANGDTYTQFFDVFSNIKTVTLFTVRRDPANTADLQKAITVTVVLDADSTKKTTLTPLTNDLSTFPTATDVASGGVYTAFQGITVSGDGTVTSPSTFTIKFAPGEFAKSIIYKVDGSKLDLSKTYGAVYKITNLGGFTGKVGYSQVGAAIAVKNQYDGTYSYAGNLVRIFADGSADANPLGGTIAAGQTVDLVTSGPTSNSIPLIYWADAATQVGGIDGLHIAIDPTTNHVTVTATTNPYLANMPGMDNYYDPTTKTFYLNFAWNGGPNTNFRQAHLTLGYSGPR